MKYVLIAEDEASIRDFVVINLRRSGYEVIEATNGEEAIQKFNENIFHSYASYQETIRPASRAALALLGCRMTPYSSRRLAWSATS